MAPEAPHPFMGKGITGSQAHEAYDCLRRGRELLEGGRAAEAIAPLERARGLEPRRGSVLEVLGRAYYNNGMAGKAKLLFEEALEIDPTNAFARYALALCMWVDGERIKAVGQLRLAVAMEPGCALYVEELERRERMAQQGNGA